MPNITKYMGKAIPGMSVIQGAWDAGQGVDSLIKGLQRLAAKQSGGPVPMEDIGKWMQKHQTSNHPEFARDRPQHTEKHIGEQEWHVRDYGDSEAIVRDPYSGFEEKTMMNDVGDLVQQMKVWDNQVKTWEIHIKGLKKYKKMSDKEYRDQREPHSNPTRKGTINDIKKYIKNSLGEYLNPRAERTTNSLRLRKMVNPDEKNEYKAKDSIWMSVLDAMKRQEKK